MAVAAPSTPAPTADPHSPDTGAANDNFPGPTKEPCRWHMLITSVRPIWPRCAVWLAQQKLRGHDFDDVCDELCRALQAGQ